MDRWASEPFWHSLSQQRMARDIHSRLLDAPPCPVPATLAAPPPPPPHLHSFSLLCVSLCPRSPTTGQLSNGPRLTSSQSVLKQAGKLTLCVLRKQNRWNAESFSCPGCVSLSDTSPPVPCVRDRKYEHLQFCLRCRVNLHERYVCGKVTDCTPRQIAPGEKGLGRTEMWTVTHVVNPQ